MKIWILSDLHRDVSRSPWNPTHIPDADVAGDVGAGLAETVAWLGRTVRPAMPVVVVPGNHEFYGSSIEDERARGGAAAGRFGVTLLDDDTVELAGATFSGGTLWTDYALDGVGRLPGAMLAARVGLNDHRRIALSNRHARVPFDPEDAATLHWITRRHLDLALLAADPAERRIRPHVVVMHHAPSRGSLDPRFVGSALNPAFASDLAGLIEAGRPDLWIHGHVHACTDHRVGATRVLCNPCGYDRENSRFDPALVVEVPS